MNGTFEDHMNLLPNLSGKTIKWNGRVFLASILSGIVAHAYCMLNLIGTEDTIGEYSRENVSILHTFVGASTGRWLSEAANRIQTWYRTPLVSGVLVILVIALLGQLIIAYFDVQSIVGMYLIAILLEVSSPTQAYMTLHEVGYPLSVLLACVSSLLMKRAEADSHKEFLNWLLAWISLSLALVILPVNLACTLTLLLLELILQTIQGEKDNFYSELKRRWRWIGACALVVLAAGGFLLLSSRFLMHVYQVGQTGYQGAEAAMNGTFVYSIFSNYLHAFIKLGIMGLWKIQIIPAFRICYYFIYVLFLTCMIVLWQKNCYSDCKRKHRMIATVELLLWGALVPVAVCTMSLLSYGFMYRGQHRMALMLLISGSVPLMERAVSSLMERTGKKASTRLPRFLYWGEIAALAAMIYGTFLFDNVGYANQHHVMEQDRSLCTRILSALDQTEGFTYDQPVYFLNILSWDGDESASALQYDPELYSVIWPVATTDLYAYGDHSFRTHMSSYEGVELVEPETAIEKRIEESDLAEKYADLQSGDFRIIQAENTWVVVVKTVGPPNVKWG